VKHVRSIAEITVALNEQRRFLRRSSAAYDEGDFAEAKRLASIIYTLAHEGTGRTKSLLGQLDLMRGRTFLSTARPIYKDVVPKLALAALTSVSTGKAAIVPLCALPHLNHQSKQLPFFKWWEEPIFQEIGQPKPNHPLGDGRYLSRKNLVFHLRSQEGGSHYDGELRHEPYLGLAVEGKIGVYVVAGDGQKQPIGSPHLASMRQIAWEMEQSLKDIPGGPEIPPPEAWPPTPYRPEDPDLWEPEQLSITSPPNHRVEKIDMTRPPSRVRD
jgi:hypothetical protein